MGHSDDLRDSDGYDPTQNCLQFFFNVGFPPGMLFSFFQQLHRHFILLRDHFLPLETVFRTHHLLDSRKEPVPDSRKEQPLPRKVI